MRPLTDCFLFSRALFLQLNRQLLIQEFLQGPEYVVDTCTKDGWFLALQHYT